jgi:3-methyladenine DNA glycosylase AlkD
VCFALFDRTPHAWAKVDQWAPSDDEYVRRAAFALLWGLSVHDKAAADGKFLRGFRHVERAASDDRHYVKKAVNMALRAIGKRNRALHAAAVSVAERLVASSSADARWVGKDALRELGSRSVASRVERASRAAD